MHFNKLIQNHTVIKQRVRCKLVTKQQLSNRARISTQSYAGACSPYHCSPFPPFCLFYCTCLLKQSPWKSNLIAKYRIMQVYSIFPVHLKKNVLIKVFLFGSHTQTEPLLAYINQLAYPHMHQA